MCYRNINQNVIASEAWQFRKNKISLVVEGYLYKKGVKEERKRRNCLRYKYPVMKREVN